MRLRKTNKATKEKGWHRLRRRQDDSDTTQIYTEQDIESLSRSQGNGLGIIRPDTGDLHMPSNLEISGDRQQSNRRPRVMLVIITCALIFIAIITYFVMQMPKKD
jgi:hypothetical protein